MISILFRDIQARFSGYIHLFTRYGSHLHITDYQLIRI